MAGVFQQGKGVLLGGEWQGCFSKEKGGGVDVTFLVTRLHLDNFLKWVELTLQELCSYSR